MSFSFYKKDSNAKFMNNLSFNIIADRDSIIIKNNKMETLLELSEQENYIVNKIENDTYKIFYSNLLLVRNGIDWIFNTTEEKYHKYINIKINCFSIYTENALKEWMYDWFSDTENNKKDNLQYMNELKEIYNKFKKCKITVN